LSPHIKYPVKCFLAFLLSVFSIAFSYSQAIDSLKNVLKTAKEDTNKVNALSNLAWELNTQEKYDESFPYINEGIALAEKLKHGLEHGNLLRRSGDYYKSKANYSKAMQEYTKALQLDTKDGRIPKMAISHARLARLYIVMGEFPKAASHFETQLKLNEEIHDTTQISDVLFSLWDLHYKKLEDVPRASSYIERVQTFVRGSASDSVHAYLFNSLGRFYSVEGDYEKAAEFLNKSLELHEKKNDLSAVASNYYDIGALYEKSGNYHKWLEYALKILKIRENLGDTAHIALAYNNAGWGYQLIGDFKNALECQLKAYQLYLAVGEDVSIAYPIGNLGLIYNELGEYEKAIEYSTKSMAIFEKTKDVGGVAESHNNIGNAYARIGNYSKAIGHLEKGLSISKEVDYLYEMKNSYSGLSMCYEKTGNFKKAHENYKLFTLIRDSIVNQENSDRVSRMQFSMENEKSQKAIELQNKTILLSEAELKRQRTLTYSAIAGVLLTILLLFFVFRGYSQKKKSNIELEQKVSERTVEVVRQKEEIEKSYRNTKLLSDIGREITASLRVEDIIEKVYANINTLMDASVLAIGIYEADKNRLCFPGDIEKGEKLPVNYEELNDENRAAVWCFKNQKEIVINDIEKEYGNYFPGKAKPVPISGETAESIIYLPLSTSKSRIGVVTVQSFKANAYSEYQIDIIRSLAIYVTIALENASLYGNMEAEVRKRTAEIEKQKEELAKLSIVASKTDNAIIIADAQANIEWVNASYTRLTGYTFEDLKAMNRTNIMMVSGNPKIQAILDDCMRKSKPAVYEVMNRTKDGRDIWVQTTLTPITGEDGKIRNLVAIDTDITELKRVETEIKQQHAIISEKNKHITDSINYAKRIQDAILPTDHTVKTMLPDAFVLYKPKDIVSGDFYWMTEKAGKLFFAVVDCTGHGVPGAFVSIIGYNGLYRSVNEFGLTKPSEILDKLNELVEETFGQNNETQIKDGMDIALCSYNPKTRELEFAGANNPLYIISKGNFSEIKGDKQPIGAFDHRKKFSNHCVTLKKEDAIYIFSDGYADQFGGAAKKKFKYNQFKAMLTGLNGMPMLEQRENLNTTITNWMGDIEQLDDICVIGVRI